MCAAQPARGIQRERLYLPTRVGEEKTNERSCTTFVSVLKVNKEKKQTFFTHISAFTFWPHSMWNTLQSSSVGRSVMSERAHHTRRKSKIRCTTCRTVRRYCNVTTCVTFRWKTRRTARRTRQPLLNCTTAVSRPIPAAVTLSLGPVYRVT